MSTVRTLSLVHNASPTDTAPAATEAAETDAPGLQTTADDRTPLKTRSITADVATFRDAENTVKRIAGRAGLKRWTVWTAILRFAMKNEEGVLAELAEIMNASNANSQSA
jgi:hypothetical protein